MSSRNTMTLLALVASGALACAGCAAQVDDQQPAADSNEEALVQGDLTTAADDVADTERTGESQDAWWGRGWGGWGRGWGGWGGWGRGWGWGGGWGGWGGGWWPGWGGGWGGWWPNYAVVVPTWGWGGGWW